MSSNKTLIDFVIEAAHYAELRDEFIRFLETKPGFPQLKSWFDKHEYIVSDDECIRILENRERIFTSIQAKNY